MFKKIIVLLVLAIVVRYTQANEIRREIFTSTESTSSEHRESVDELMKFYNNEEFSSGVYYEIQAALMMADSGEIQSDLKDIFPKKCDILIDKIASTVHNLVTPILMDGANDMKRVCPQWEKLSEDDRKDFYVALVTSMALAESSCNNGAQNRGAPNGTAYGYWQSTKRLSAVGGAKWVMGQLENQIEQSGLLFWANSKFNYWAVLNPNIHAGKVKKLLKKIPACVVRKIAETK
jgi:hypothetical protein